MPRRQGHVEDSSDPESIAREIKGSPCDITALLSWSLVAFQESFQDG